MSYCIHRQSQQAQNATHLGRTFDRGQGLCSASVHKTAVVALVHVQLTRGGRIRRRRKDVESRIPRGSMHKDKAKLATNRASTNAQFGRRSLPDRCIQIQVRDKGQPRKVVVVGLGAIENAPIQRHVGNLRNLVAKHHASVT